MNPIKQRVEELLARMTLDEKLAQTQSHWIYELQTSGEVDDDKLHSNLQHGIGQITRVAGASTMEPQQAARAGNRIQKFLREETRLGIPAVLHEESCSGAMLLGGSIFPQMIGLASTFQPELAEKMSQEIRKQLMAVGARQTLAPVLDVSRDPRWGRIEETFGEDPMLVSQFGMAYIRGMQGTELADGVMATGKHFIGHSLSQGGQNCGPVQVGKHELYEIFLAPFQAAIREAGLATIMNSYPELDGEVVAASRRILTGLLREELGFTGLVVSDYQAVSMLNNFHYRAKDLAEAGRLALQAGIDVELPSIECYGDGIKKSIESGELSMEILDTAVSRHLRKKFELGLFENPYVDEGRVYEVFETNTQRELAREIARKSMVLLKNDGLLPLKKDIHRLAVIGPNANEQRNLCGDYSYAATVELLRLQAPETSDFTAPDLEKLQKNSPEVVSILEAIKKSVSPTTLVSYAKGCDLLGPDDSGIAPAIKTAQQADAVILVLGDKSGLVPDCTTGETRDSAELKLPGLQEALAKAVLETGKPVVVVLVTGRPYALRWMDEKANAILEAWLPGEEGGTAAAEILFGDANPGGKLPVTFPRHVGQVPIFYNHKPSGMKSHWYGDYVSEKAAPLYPFGHGLSYTSFEYSELRIEKTKATLGETVEISFKVTNCGRSAGDEVVQLYTRDEYGRVPRPVKELKGYRRIRLEPGEGRLVTFRLPINLLAFHNLENKLVLEAGRIFIMAGSSSEDIRLNGEMEISGSEQMDVKERLFSCPVEVA